LNLQPAVLETAALPVELRPFSRLAGQPALTYRGYKTHALSVRWSPNRRTARC